MEKRAKGQKSKVLGLKTKKSQVQRSSCKTSGKTVKFRRDTHGDEIKHGWNNRKSKDCIIESTATYSPKTSNRFEVLGGIATFDDDDTGEEESYAG